MERSTIIKISICVGTIIEIIGSMLVGIQIGTQQTDKKWEKLVQDMYAAHTSIFLMDSEGRTVKGMVNICKMDDGTLKEFDATQFISDNVWDYYDPNTYDYIGNGVIYSIGGVTQKFTEPMSFYKKKAVPNNEAEPNRQ